MKLAAFIFFLLLLHAHGVGDLAQPFSLLRDGKQGWLGYVLFAVLLLIGLLYTAVLMRASRVGQAAVSGFAVLLLLLVAVTPSWGAFHVLCSLLLLLLLFSYAAGLLYQTAILWLAAHLFVPVALAWATHFHSYGIWQKSFIAYFVLVVVVHYHMVGQKLKRSSALPGETWLSQRGPSLRRRKVYRLEAGREWGRQLYPPTGVIRSRK